MEATSSYHCEVFFPDKLRPHCQGTGMVPVNKLFLFINGLASTLVQNMIVAKVAGAAITLYRMVIDYAIHDQPYNGYHNNTTQQHITEIKYKQNNKP